MALSIELTNVVEDIQVALIIRVKRRCSYTKPDEFSVQGSALSDQRDDRFVPAAYRWTRWPATVTALWHRACLQPTKNFHKPEKLVRPRDGAALTARYQ